MATAQVDHRVEARSITRTDVDHIARRLGLAPADAERLRHAVSTDAGLRGDAWRVILLVLLVLTAGAGGLLSTVEMRGLPGVTLALLLEFLVFSLVGVLIQVMRVSVCGLIRTIAGLLLHGDGVLTLEQRDTLLHLASAPRLSEWRRIQAIGALAAVVAFAMAYSLADQEWSMLWSSVGIASALWSVLAKQIVLPYELLAVALWRLYLEEREGLSGR